MMANSPDELVKVHAAAVEPVLGLLVQVAIVIVQQLTAVEPLYTP
jgi:hypothetical protein